MVFLGIYRSDLQKRVEIGPLREKTQPYLALFLAIFSFHTIWFFPSELIILFYDDFEHISYLQNIVKKGPDLALKGKKTAISDQFCSFTDIKFFQAIHFLLWRFWAYIDHIVICKEFVKKGQLSALQCQKSICCPFLQFFRLRYLFSEWIYLVF